MNNVNRVCISLFTVCFIALQIDEKLRQDLIGSHGGDILLEINYVFIVIIFLMSFRCKVINGYSFFLFKTKLIHEFRYKEEIVYAASTENRTKYVEKSFPYIPIGRK